MSAITEAKTKDAPEAAGPEFSGGKPVEYAVQPERRKAPRPPIPASLLEEWRRNDLAGLQAAAPSQGLHAEPDLTGGSGDGAEARIIELEQLLAEEERSSQRRVELARAEGYEQARQELQAGMVRRVEQERELVGRALDQFAGEREGYFRRVEREVVRLALAIAARILHREAQMDPLLLAGAVRVALEKLADTSDLVLRTTPVQVMAWQEMLRLGGDARVRVEVLGDMALEAGECILETRLGTVELGVKAQLEEIEKGFFDLLDQKPGRTG